MKKTMFITSVIMVVVMAIALTTSSLAWFTAAGSSTVTTSTMTLTAKSTAATGLLISSAANGPWYGNLDLISGNSQPNMMPSMPYVYTEEAIDDYIPEPGVSDVHECGLLDALVNGKFINNTVDINNNYSTDAPVKTNSADKQLFFSKDLYITSIDTANKLFVTPTIEWYDSTGVAYVFDTAHPLVYVAVLAEQDPVVRADRDSSLTYEAGERQWEIVNIFCSANYDSTHTNITSVNFGRTEDYFQSVATPSVVNKSIAASYSSTALSSFTGITTDSLDQIGVSVEDDKTQSYGEVKQFKVVAWYDGQALKNANSTFGLKFKLTFTASHV